MFEALESILANFDLSHFGTLNQGFLILSNILQHVSDFTIAISIYKDSSIFV